MANTVQMKESQPEATDLPEGVDRRAVLMRSAVAGAVAVISNGRS